MMLTRRRSDSCHEVRTSDRPFADDYLRLIKRGPFPTNLRESRRAERRSRDEGHMEDDERHEDDDEAKRARAAGCHHGHSPGAGASTRGPARLGPAGPLR